MVFPHKSDNHDMVRVILLMKMTTNAVVTWSAFSITDENSGNKALKNPGTEHKVQILCYVSLVTFTAGENDNFRNKAKCSYLTIVICVIL